MSAAPSRNWQDLITALSPDRAAVLAQRARAAPLYAHAYAFHLNMRFGAVSPEDLLEFAAAQSLCGVKIHVEDGETRSLRARDFSGQASFGAHARRLGLDLHIETSATDAASLNELFAIGRATGASALRFYPRHTGPLSQVLAQCVADLRLLSQIDPVGQFRLLLEQHEDLRSEELVGILQAVANPHLHLLFDFGNMINALEMPLPALACQSAFVTDVHVKDCRILPDRGGFAHLACASGTGDVPMQALLVELLLLGETAPQILAYGLEEEEGYYAPAFRFPDEGPDPHIPMRGASQTDPGSSDLGERLGVEYAAAEAQVALVRRMLAEIADAADQRPSIART